MFGIIERLKRIEHTQQAILNNQHFIIQKLNKMDQSLENLQAEVAQDTTVMGSAVTLIQGIKAQLDAAIAANGAGDSTQLDALSASLGASRESLAAAITANTPVATPGS